MVGNKKITIVTHSSGFHTDDIFAVATLLLTLGGGDNISVVRSRDKSIIESADYVTDVGDLYDPSRNRFDHHQKGGAGKRENGVPYASFGLVWKEFGQKLSGDKAVADKIDQMIVQPIDAGDNGMKFFDARIPGLYPFDIELLTSIFYPTWKEDPDNFDDIFNTLVSYAKTIISRLIISVRDDTEAESLVVEAYKNSPDKRLIEVGDRYPWEEVLSKFPEPIFVIYKNKDNNWTIEGVRSDQFSYKSRKDLPESWAGRRDEELEKITTVAGAVFCHNARFMAVNKTKEGILKMAEIALNS